MEFKNRRAQYPGRVKLVKVSGSTDLYDMTLADGSVSGSYEAGTPLNADTFNALLAEIESKIKAEKLNSIRTYDGTNYGVKLTIGDNKDLVVNLPTTINATLNGTANVSKEVSTSYGKVITKSVYLSTSYTTVYTATTGSTILVLLSPHADANQNTAIFAASYVNTKTSIDNVTYINNTGHINKQWNGENFQISMSNANANGYYAITIVEAHN